MSTGARTGLKQPLAQEYWAASQRELDLRFEQLQRESDLRHGMLIQQITEYLVSQRASVAVANASMEKRLDSMNEFRQSLSDQARTQMPRAECEASLKSLTEKIDANTVRLNTRDERIRGAGLLWAYVVGAIGVGIAVLTLVFRVVSH